MLDPQTGSSCDLSPIASAPLTQGTAVGCPIKVVEDAVYHTDVNMFLPLHLHMHAACIVYLPRKDNDTVSCSDNGVAELP